MYVFVASYRASHSFSPYRYRFSSTDVQPFALQLLNALLSKIQAPQSPERVAENDFLMRCAPVLSFLMMQTSTQI